MKCGNCKQDHRTVAMVKECYAQGVVVLNGSGTGAWQVPMEGVTPDIMPERTPVPQGFKADERTATFKQLGYLKLLVAERDWPTAGKNEEEARIVATCENTMEGKAIRLNEAAVAIAYLKAKPKRALVKVTDLAEGWYLRPPTTDSTLETGIIWMVYRTLHGRNELVAKELLITEAGSDDDGMPTFQGEWIYRGKRGLIGLTPEMLLTQEQAKKMGCLYGVCVRCARSLTRDESKHVGYGKTCANKMGWWYPTRAELKALLEQKAEVKS